MSDSSAAVPASPPSRRARWGWWLLGIGAVLGVVVAVALALLDPWLKRQLEQQVRDKTHGQYTLRIGRLETHLLSRSIRLRYLHLQPAATVADTLPRLHLAAADLSLNGIGLLALLRKQVVPIDSLGLDSLRVVLLALPSKAAPHPDPRPLHQRLPLQLPGLRLSHLWLHAAHVVARDGRHPLGLLRRADLRATDLLLTAAGAADTQRLGYAASWQLALRNLAANAPRHWLQMRQLVVDSRRQYVQLDSLRIWPKHTPHTRPEKAHFRLRLRQLRGTGWQLAAWQHQHQLRADSLVLEQPRLYFWPPNEAPPPVWKMLAPLFERGTLRGFRVRHGQLAFGGLTHRPVARNLSLLGQQLRVDSLAGQAGSGRILYARRWAGSSGLITAVFSAPEYPVSVRHLDFDTRGGLVRLRQLALRPTFTPAQLNRYKGYQKSTIEVLMEELRADGLDFARLADYRDVAIRRVRLQRPRLTIRSDGRGPITPYPADVTPENVRRLRFGLDVRRLDLYHGSLTSFYRSPATPLVGTLRLTCFNASIWNFNNNPRRQNARHPMTGQAVAYFEDQCRMTVHLTANLLDPEGRHDGYGTFGPAQLAILNPMLAATHAVRFRSGLVDGISFRLHGDRQRVTGSLTARYHDLGFQLLTYKNGELDKTLLTRLKTGAANLVVRDQNPRPGGRLVTGRMLSRRELRFSVFSLWRQGIVSGGLNNVGVPMKLAEHFSEIQDKGPLPPAGTR